MILSDPSFERSHRGEHYALYLEMEMSGGYANNYDYRPIFDRFFSNILLKFFCKGPWSAHNNIIYTNICQKLS